ncbi:MAG: glycosyltransferase family 9 protein [Bdellovibrionaceae bacterium]|nr:glycosyltransferase family 9 protein [Pseudobdellovibrionaceae bacterium]
MKILILRFSSFGDVTQCLSVPSQILSSYPAAEVHWAVREDLAELLNAHPAIHKVWPLPRESGLLGLWRFGFDLRRQNYTHLYDAHNNLRSRILSLLVRGFKFGGPGVSFIRKSQKRWKRFLLFKARIDTYEKPLSGQRDLLEPLAPWKVAKTLPPTPQIFISKEAQQKVLAEIPWAPLSFVALAPSSAFVLKRWPIEAWSQLIRLCPEEKFVLLGGPGDTFLEKLAAEFPQQVLNFAGRFSLLESGAAIEFSQALIANDTGLLHVGEQLGKPTIALMGPAPFGFPSRPLTRILQRDLACRPCSKHGQGPCTNPQYQDCLRGISAETVAQNLKGILSK